MNHIPYGHTLVSGYLENGQRCENPHKYLLFKPSPSQLLVYLASGCNELPHTGALLIYISADGQSLQPSRNPEDGKRRLRDDFL